MAMLETERRFLPRGSCSASWPRQVWLVELVCSSSRCSCSVVQAPASQLAALLHDRKKKEGFRKAIQHEPHGMLYSEAGLSKACQLCSFSCSNRSDACSHEHGRHHDKGTSACMIVQAQLTGMRQVGLSGQQQTAQACCLATASFQSHSAPTPCPSDWQPACLLPCSLVQHGLPFGVEVSQWAWTLLGC